MTARQHSFLPLTRLAEEHGIEVPLRELRAMRDILTDEAVAERLRNAARLRDAAACELGIPIAAVVALRYLENGRCTAAAVERLRRDAREGALRASPRASRALVRFAEEQGVELSQEAAARRASRGLGSAREHVRSLARVRDAGGRHGVRIDTASAVRRLGGARGDERLAVSRIEARARRRQQGASHLCLARGRTHTGADPVTLAAACGCHSCFYRLAELLEGYTATVLVRRGYRRRDWDAWEEGTQEAGAVLWESYCAWCEGEGFPAYYGGNLANRLSGLAAKARTIKRGEGDTPLSLFNTYVGRSGEPVHLIDLLPVHCDPQTILLIKERILEARTVRYDDVARVGRLYDAKRERS